MGGPPGMPPSPYGGMPMQPGQGQGQSNRAMLYAVLGGVGALALVGLIFLLVRGGDDDEEPPSDETASTDTTDTTAPPDDGGGGDGGGGDGGGGGGGSGGDCVAGADETWDGESHWSTPCDGHDLEAGLVVESYGFSSTPESISGSNLETTYAAIIENTSDEDIDQVSITFSMYDATGDIKASEEQSITMLGAGERTAVGGYIENPIPIDSVTVSSGAPSEASSYDEPGEGNFTVTGTSALEDDSLTQVTFEVESTYEHTIDPYDLNAIAVFKNEDGGVIGGGGSSFGLSAIPGGGTTSASMDIYTVLADADLDQTEVFVGCGYSYCSPP